MSLRSSGLRLLIGIFALVANLLVGRDKKYKPDNEGRADDWPKQPFPTPQLMPPISPLTLPPLIPLLQGTPERTSLQTFPVSASL
jgi:hypothetical protein